MCEELFDEFIEAGILLRYVRKNTFNRSSGQLLQILSFTLVEGSIAEGKTRDGQIGLLLQFFALFVEEELKLVIARTEQTDDPLVRPIVGMSVDNLQRIRRLSLLPIQCLE